MIRTSANNTAMKLSFFICCELVSDTNDAPKGLMSTFPFIVFSAVAIAFSIWSISMALLDVSLTGY